MSSAICFNFNQSIFLSFGNGLTLSQTINFYPSKLKEFADDSFRFDGNGRKFLKTLGKGEIARYEQFLLYP